MATVSVSVASALLNPANFFAVGIYDASSGALLETVAPVKGGGYTNPFQVTFLNSYILGKVYRVIVWENTTAVVGGTSRVSGSVTPSVNSTSFRTDEILVYGTDAIMTNPTTIVDPSLIGWDISFEQFGTGTLTPGAGKDYTYDKTSGTIILVNGTTYQNGQKMVIHFLPQVAAVAPSFSGISTGFILAVSTVMGNSYANSAVYLMGSGGSFIATLPALSTMSDYQPIEFYSDGGNHTYVTLLAAGTDKIQYNVLRTKLFLRQGVSVTLFKANGVWKVKGNTAPMDMIGEVVYKYSNTDFPYILADGSAGGLLSRATYAGLWDYISGNAAALTTEAAWGNTSVLDGVTYFPNKGKWTAGDGSTNFRAPLLINQFICGADGSSRQPGSFQADAMQKHTHDTVMGGTGGAYPFGKTPTNEIAGGDSGGFSVRGKLSSPPYTAPGAGADGALIVRVDTKTRPENISLFALIRL